MLAFAFWSELKVRAAKPVSKHTNLHQILLPTLFILLTGLRVSGQPAQSMPASRSHAESDPAVVQTADLSAVTSLQNTGNPQDDVQKRIDRARALAAAHQLQSAAGELEAVRRNTRDEVVRNVTSVMLMGIYLEDGNYMRAQSLLDEDFRNRASGKDSALPTYFAIAGQAVNGARAHLSRYRTFGINIADSTLPPEALTDLDKLRSLLERMAIQAKEISVERKTHDVLALLEDVLGLRLSIARDAEDRAKWELEYAEARHGLASSQTQIAALGSVPSLQRSVGDSSTRSNPAAKEPPAEIKEPDAANALGSSNETGNSLATESSAQPNGDEAKSPNSPGKVVSTGILNQRATKRVVPTYPPVAKAGGVAGTVRVHVTVDESGKVADVTQVEGPLMLRKAAEEAAKGWRFPPTTLNGKLVRLAGFIEFSFTR